MENKSFSNSILLSLSILAGLMLLGYFIFKGLKTFSDKDRVVTVKGLAEMNMTAYSASAELQFSFSGDNLKDLIRQAENKKNAIINYLTVSGYNDSIIKANNIQVTDRQKYYETRWINGKEVEVKTDRYTVTQSLTIRLDDVLTAENKSSQIELDLINKDLTCKVSTRYSFPELNTIKPQLIAESTKNARIAGEQFAKDSQAKLGKIKTASQGQISIAGNYYYDEAGIEGFEKPMEPYLQKARVVSTIVFFLE